MKRGLLFGCGAASSVLYGVTDLLGSRRYPGYRVRDQWFSELTAQGAPTRSMMVALNGIPYTGLISAFAAGLWTSPLRTPRVRATAGCLAGYAGFGMAGGIAFPMKPREDLAAGNGTLRNSLHIPATMLMSASLLAAMIFGGGLLGPRFRRYTHGTIATVVAFGAATGAQGGNITAGKPTPWSGILERVNIYATMLWIAVFAALFAEGERTQAG